MRLRSSAREARANVTKTNKLIVDSTNAAPQKFAMCVSDGGELRWQTFEEIGGEPLPTTGQVPSAGPAGEVVWITPVSAGGPGTAQFTAQWLPAGFAADGINLVCSGPTVASCVLQTPIWYTHAANVVTIFGAIAPSLTPPTLQVEFNSEFGPTFLKVKLPVAGIPNTVAASQLTLWDGFATITSINALAAVTADGQYLGLVVFFKNDPVSPFVQGSSDKLIDFRCSYRAAVTI